MANYNTLISAIQSVIAENGNNEITGNILQQTLVAMIGALGGGYQFAGIATPSTTPGTPDEKIFYLGSAGTYPNFGPAVIPSGNMGVFYYDSGWHVGNIEFPIGEGTITKANLSSILLNELLAGFVYAGKATPTGNPGTIIRDSFFLTTAPGTYSNYGNLAVQAGEIAVLRYVVSTDTWAKESIEIPEMVQVVNNLMEGGADSALSAEMGKLLGQYILGELLHLDNNNTVLADYGSFTTTGSLTRGYIAIKVNKTIGFRGTVEVHSGSPIKYSLSIRTNPQQSAVYDYDTGWKQGGESATITDADITSTQDRYLTLTATYISGNTGVPTFAEFLQYATFSLVSNNRQENGLLQRTTALENEVFGADTIETITQDDFLAANYSSYSSGGLTRAVLIFPIHFPFELTVSVALGSTIKVGVQGRTSLPISGSAEYDSGWITPGQSYTANVADFQNKNINYLCLPVTYVETNTGVPSIEEIRQYITFTYTYGGKTESLKEQIQAVNSFNQRGILAHRGFHLNGVPENSLDAFRYAGMCQFAFAEADFSATLDGYLVVMHDASINRTMRNADYTPISGTVNVASKTLAELMNNYVLTATDKRYRRKIPLLEDYFKICKQYGVFPLPEIKATGTSSTDVKNAYEMGCAILGEGNFGFASFSYALLDYVRSLSKRTPLMYSGAPIIDTNNSITGESRNNPNNIWYQNYESSFFTKEMIEECHKRNIMVACYTIPVEDIDYVLKLGADIIVTDKVAPFRLNNGEWTTSFVNFNDFTTDGVISDNSLILTSGQTVSLNGTNIWMGGYLLEIIAKGSFTINAPNLSKTITASDIDRFVFSGLIDNKTLNFSLTALADTEIQFINLKSWDI